LAAGPRHGGGGGWLPDSLTDFVSVIVRVPPGDLIVICDFSLDSSLHQASPNPRPLNTRPTNIARIFFGICRASSLERAAASDLA
jgi:hypothetical protein